MWKRARVYVIARDYGCDLGVEGREIYDKVYVHHMNPMVADDIKHSNLDIIDPEFIICVAHDTHNDIHYGDESLLYRKQYTPRQHGDTKLW